MSSSGAMICDRVRMSAYTKALKQVVTEDSVVLDLGAGTGIFSLLACHLGASKVYAIEPFDAICGGEEAARRDGFGQIEFIQNMSQHTELPQSVDVMVSDLRALRRFCNITFHRSSTRGPGSCRRVKYRSPDVTTFG